MKDEFKESLSYPDCLNKWAHFLVRWLVNWWNSHLRMSYESHCLLCYVMHVNLGATKHTLLSEEDWFLKWRDPEGCK